MDPLRRDDLKRPFRRDVLWGVCGGLLGLGGGAYQLATSSAHSVLDFGLLGIGALSTALLIHGLRGLRAADAVVSKLEALRRDLPPGCGGAVKAPGRTCGELDLDDDIPVGLFLCDTCARAAGVEVEVDREAEAPRQRGP